MTKTKVAKTKETAQPRPMTEKKDQKRKRPAALTKQRTHALRKDQLQRYRMLEAEARAAQAEYQMADLRYNTLVGQRPEIVEAQTRRRAAQESFRKARKDYVEYVEGLGKQLSLDMRRVAIDDQTGMVREIPGTEVPDSV